MDIQNIKTELINPSKYNPRKDLKPGDKEYENLKRSIETFGYVELVVWNKRTGNIISGHQRYTVLLDLGYTEIDCIIVDMDDQNEKALNMAMNRIGGAWDEDKLAGLIADLDANAFDVSLTGFDAAEIDDLMNRFYSKEAVEDNFDLEKEKAEIESKGAVTQPGDIWLLGNHRLMCGDSTKAEDFTKLMDGNHAAMAITSPPYGVSKDYEQAGIEPWFETMRPAIKNICKHAGIVCWQIVDLYCTGTQYIEPTGFYSVQMFADNGFRPIWIRIWKKPGMNMGLGPYHLVSNKPAQQYEYIITLADKDAEECNNQDFMWITAFANHSYKFVKRLTKEERKLWGYSGIWEISPASASRIGHSAPYPIELPWRCIKLHSNKSDIILEPFSGSGSTLIATEQLERRCFAMELSPVYCDLAVKRFEEITGVEAVRLEG